MPATNKDQVTMEKTPSYFITRDVPAKVSRMSPSTRLLVVVRDPVTRAVSDYTQAASKWRTNKTFDQLTFLNSTTGLIDTDWSALRIGVYCKYLERWLQHFPLSQFHFVSGEGLVKDPAHEMAKVQEFLGLSRHVKEEHFVFNATKGFPCWRKSINDTVRCLGKTKGRVHPNISPSTDTRLREFYKPFNIKFYRMTGVDFGWT